MPELDAYKLNNWFPRGSYLQARGGSASWATGMSGTVKTLFQHKPISGTDKLFAATDAGIYDITVTGPVGALAVALTNGFWNTVNITNSAGTTYNWGCNGQDGVFVYSGSWTNITAGITGVDAHTLIFPWLFKHRIFAIQKNTMNAWFLPIDSIQGAASQFPLGNLFKRGGYLVSGTNWTLDAGDGPDDYCVFITSEGEIAVYAGTDPSSASSIGLVGVYYVGRPLGNRCFVRLGGDVIVMVESGFHQLSKLLQAGSVNFNTALTRKIQPTITDEARRFFSENSWCGVVYPQYDAFIANIPQGLADNIQYAMNTVTGALCSFSGWNAKCFEVFQGVLYFGSTNGVAWRAWDGDISADNGQDVVALCAQAYNYFGRASRVKKCGVFRPLLSYDGTVELRTAISADFQGLLVPASITPRASSTAGPVWNVSPWDTTPWSVGQQLYKYWRGASHAPGFALSLILEARQNNCQVLQWSGTDFVLETGGIL